MRYFKKPGVFVPVFTFGIAFTITWAQRGSDPFIFRATLPDNANRILIISLASNFTAAYSGETAGLYQVWNGGFRDANDTYTHSQYGSNHSPQGDILHTQESENLWTLSVGGGSADITVRYMGYSVSGEDATLHYQIQRDGAGPIDVYETPEKSPGSLSLERAFRVEGLPEGAVLRHRLTGGNGDAWSAEGTGEIINTGGNSHYEQSTDGETVVTGSWQ